MKSTLAKEKIRAILLTLRVSFSNPTKLREAIAPCASAR